MKIKDIGKLRIGELKEIQQGDVVELLDELRAIATKRGTELLGQSKHQARRAIGAPSQGAVSGALMIGIVLGAVVAAVVTLLWTPMAGPEARRRLTEEVDKVKERVPAGAKQYGNGRSVYEPLTPTAEVGSTGGSLRTPSA